MSVVSSDAPDPLPSLSHDLLRTLETLIALAHQQRACLQVGDVGALESILRRKAALISEIDSCRHALTDCLPQAPGKDDRIHEERHVPALPADWRLQIHSLLAHLDAIERECLSSLAARLAQAREELTSLARTRRLTASYGSMCAPSCPHRYVSRRS